MKCNSPHSSIFVRSLFFYCLLGAGHEEHWLFWKPGWTVACLWWCQMTHLYLYVEVQHNCTPTLPHFTFLRGSLLSLWNPSFMSITAGFYSLFDCILALESLRSAGMCRISLRCSVFLFYFLEWIKEEVWFAGLRTRMFLTKQTKAPCLSGRWVAMMSLSYSQTSCCVPVLKHICKSCWTASAARSTNKLDHRGSSGRQSNCRKACIHCGSVEDPPRCWNSPFLALFFPSVSLVESFFFVWGQFIVEVVLLLWHKWKIASTKCVSSHVYCELESALTHLVNFAF